MKVVLKEGQIYEYNGEDLKIYGKNIIEVVAEDNLVVALDNKGRIHEFKHGRKIKSYGTGLITIQLINGVVIGNDIFNFRNEYIDGIKNRSFLLK
jgi:hypothetical protein